MWSRKLVFGPLLAVSLLGAAALSLSDRLLYAPVKALAWRAADTGRSAEYALGLDLVSREQIPGGPDALGHFAMWAVIGTIGAVATKSVASRVALLSALFASSALLELAQPVLSWSRSASPSDLLGNGLGLLLGAFVGSGLNVWASRFSPVAHRQGANSHRHRA